MGRVYQIVCVPDHPLGWAFSSLPFRRLLTPGAWPQRQSSRCKGRRAPPLKAGPAGPPQTQGCDAFLPPPPQPLPSTASSGAASTGPEDDLSHPGDFRRWAQGEGLLPAWAALCWGPHCLPSCSDQGAPPGSGMNLWTLDTPLPRWRMEQSTSWRPSTPCRSTRGWLTSRAA